MGERQPLDLAVFEEHRVDEEPEGNEPGATNHVQDVQFPSKAPIWEDVPKEIVKGGSEVLLSYLRNLAAGKTKNYSMNLVVVGPQFSGERPHYL